MFVYFEEEQGLFGTQVPKPRQSLKAPSQVSRPLSHPLGCAGSSPALCQEGPRGPLQSPNAANGSWTSFALYKMGTFEKLVTTKIPLPNTMKKHIIPKIFHIISRVHRLLEPRHGPLPMSPRLKIIINMMEK